MTGMVEMEEMGVKRTARKMEMVGPPLLVHCHVLMTNTHMYLAEKSQLVELAT